MRPYLHIALILLLTAASYRPMAQQVSSTDTVTVHTMHGTYYSDKFVGRKTSSGEIFSQERFTAAHKSYKFGTLLLVTNPANGKQVIVRVNDRCPRSNVIDLTRRAAKRIGISSKKVQVRVLPQRYYQVWESQDLVEELVFEGLVPNLVQEPQTPSKSTNDQATAKAKGDNQQLYNILLIPCCSRADAERKVLQLPVYHQDNIRFKPCNTSSRCQVILELATHRNHAEKVWKEIKALFPEAELVKID